MGRPLELLLLLTALLASLTGTGSGDRAVRQVQGVAMVQAVDVAKTAVSPAHRAIPAAAAPLRVSAERVTWSRRESAPIPATYLPFERRLE